MPHDLTNWESEFDKLFPCIQSDCDGTGCIPVAKTVGRQISETEFVEDVEWEAEQCEFHCKYIDPAKDFIRSLLEQAKLEGRTRLKREVKQMIEEAGHQQDDDTIWCNMDELLTTLDQLGE